MQAQSTSALFALWNRWVDVFVNFRACKYYIYN